MRPSRLGRVRLDKALIADEDEGDGDGERGREPMHRIHVHQNGRLGHVHPQHPGHRTIYCNDRDANQLSKFQGNSVSTTKYNVLTFFAKRFV